MAKILTTDEMLEALRRADSPEFERCLAIVENSVNQVALAVCRHFGVEMGDGGATFEGLELNGTACSFYAKDLEHHLPKGLERYDQGGTWETKPERA